MGSLRALLCVIALRRSSGSFNRPCNESSKPKDAHKRGAAPPVGFVVLKVGNSGSSWFSSLVARLDKTYFLDEAFTSSGKHAAPTSDADLQRYLARALAEPTGYYGSEGCARWGAQSPAALACFQDKECRLRAVGFSYNPLPSEGKELAPFERVVPGWLTANLPAARLVVWVRTNVVKMALATHGDKSAAHHYGAASDPAKYLSMRNESMKTDLGRFSATVNLLIQRNMALLDWAHAAGDRALLCYYEAFQLDAYAEMERVRKFLGVPRTPGRSYDSASVKASSEDLRRLDAFPALRSLLMAERNTCLRAMLEDTTPRVYPRCRVLKREGQGNSPEPS
jgi:hypothetical protein